jgi:two-component system cell cycle sensor histidine kinase/response regulator CckA
MCPQEKSPTMNTTKQLGLRTLSRIPQVFGLTAAGLGILGLMGWILGYPALSSFGADQIPMAPSTSLLCVLTGGMLSFSSHSPRNRRTHVVGVFICSIVLLSSLLLLFLSFNGTHTQFEHLGLAITGTVGGIPIGYMSAVTAICFVGCAVSLLLTLFSSIDRKKLAVTAFMLAYLVLLTSSLLLIEYVIGTPMMFGDEDIPPALPTSLALFLLSLGLVVAPAWQLWQTRHTHDGETTRLSYVLLTVFAILGACILTGGYAAFRNYEQNYLIEVNRRLSNIADLKVNQLELYRRERSGNGEILLKNASFANLVRRFFNKANDVDAQYQLLTWLAKYRTYYDYDRVFLLDTFGVTRMCVPFAQDSISPFLAKQTSRILLSRKCFLQDFYRDDHDKKTYLAVFIPLMSDLDSNRSLGILVLRIDPTITLYPLIQHWPTPSRTSQTLILRREADDLVLLNDLRFQEHTALNMRVPLTVKSEPGVKAVMGQKGVVVGRDYRGEQTIADVREVPDSPWFLVARVDLSEVYGPIRDRFWLMIVLMGALLVGVGGVGGLVWRQLQNRLFWARYESAEALRHAERRYRRLFEAAKEGILILDAETGMIVDVNPYLVEMLGFSHAEFLGKRFWDIGFFRNIAANQAKLVELQQQKYVRYEDLPLETADGKKVDVELVSNLYMVDQRSVMQCNIRNITERKHAKERLREAQILLRSSIESPKDMSILSIDAQYRYLYCNEAHKDAMVHGYGTHVGIGMNLLDCITNSDDRHRARTNYERAMAGESHITIELFGELERYYYETRYNPIVNDKKEIIGATAFSADISDRKRAEEEKRILEAELQQAQKLESLGTLTSGIAHDFNNILGIILGNAALLERSPGDSRTIKRTTEAIAIAGRRGAALVKQMLTFVRKTDVQVDSVDLNDSVGEVVNLLAGTFPKTIIIVQNLEKSLPLIEADATQLHQVMVNLCVNARDAMPDGGTLTISTYREPGELVSSKWPKGKAHEYIVLSLSDNGVGMDEATQRRIFEPLFTTKAVGKGTGLGLSIVSGIMERHQGFVDVQSDPGKGTVFHCYFPVPQASIEPKQLEEQPTTEARGGSETILLVEDEELLKELVRSLLEAKGYRVLTAGDGEEAINVFQQHQQEIKVIITDLDLPKFSGDELCRRITVINPRIPLILASGFIEPGMKSQVFGDGVKGFLQKPYKANEVLRSVRAVLDNAAGRG